MTEYAVSIWVVDSWVYTYRKIHPAVYLNLLHLIHIDWMFNLKKVSLPKSFQKVAKKGRVIPFTLHLNEE